MQVYTVLLLLVISFSEEDDRLILAHCVGSLSCFFLLPLSREDVLFQHTHGSSYAHVLEKMFSFSTFVTTWVHASIFS